MSLVRPGGAGLSLVSGAGRATPTFSGSIAPAAATTAGGDTLVIAAAGFAPLITAVRFGATAAAALGTATAGGVSVTTPALSAGNHAVFATVGGREYLVGAVTVSAGGTVTPLRISDWSSGLGRDHLLDEAQADPWEDNEGNGSQNTVIANDGTYNFPPHMENLFQVGGDVGDRVDPPGTTSEQLVHYGLGTQAAGTWRWQRIYLCVLSTIPRGATGVDQHIWEEEDAAGAISARNWWFHVYVETQSMGADRWAPNFVAAGAGGTHERWGPTNSGSRIIAGGVYVGQTFEFNHVYRLEFGFYVSADGLKFGMAARMYDCEKSDGMGGMEYDPEEPLMFGEDKWFDTSTTPTNLESFGANFTMKDILATGSLRLGSNGLAGPESDPEGVAAFYLIGGHGMSEENWCGPYKTLTDEPQPA